MKILISVLLNMPRVVALEVKRNRVNKGTVSYLKILNECVMCCRVYNIMLNFLSKETGLCLTPIKI